MKKFFPSPNSLQLPVAVMIRPLLHSKSTGNLVCTGALIGHQNADISPMFDELPNRYEVSRGEIVVQPTVRFKLEKETFVLWQSTHSTIQSQNPKLACVSTQVFFLFGGLENCADLNSTQQFLQGMFQDTQTYSIDYTGDAPELIPFTAPFETKKIMISTTKNQDIYFDLFQNVLKQLDKLSAPQNHVPQKESESCFANL